MMSKGGLQYIATNQLKDGGFTGVRLENNKIIQGKEYQTTFIPSLIALALKQVPSSEKIRQGVAQFLLEQKSDSWSWNYWDRHSALATRTPYPDDLDDTFLALMVLWGEDEELLTPMVMAEITHLLFATETRTGGPYRTWLVNADADVIWRDVDLVVNMNIARFLALQDVELPHLNQLFETAIRKREFSSSYYPPLLPAAYFLSHFYKGRYTNKLQQHILSFQLLGTWETPHQTALAVSGLLRLGYDPESLQRAVSFIIETQRGDGSWPAGAMCWDIASGEEYGRYFVGADSLSTALCLEALSLYDQAVKRVKKQFIIPDLYASVTGDIKNTIATIKQRELRQSVRLIVDRILESDVNEQVILLPQFLARAVGAKVENQTLCQLAEASLWGWAAYTIYDDFLDNEGDPSFLPGAIFANRQLFSVLGRTLTTNVEFQDDVQEIMVRLEAANAWEVNHCRGQVKNDQLIINTLPDYRDYWQLADRSLGHTIAGLGALYAGDFRRDSSVMNNLKIFFFHYLIARQLNDDAHDWENDLRMGHVNVVGAAILERWIVSGHELVEGVDLVKDMSQLQLIMWETVIDDVCQSIHEHASRARAAIKAMEVADASSLLALLVPLERAAIKAIKTRDEVKEFSELL